MGLYNIFTILTFIFLVVCFYVFLFLAAKYIDKIKNKYNPKKTSRFN